MSNVASASSLRFNAPPPDNDAQRATLVRELRVAKGFTLIFALCNSVEERTRQRTLLQNELPALRIQEIAVRREIPHLLDVLRATLEDPLPDAVFVYGMENWIPRDVVPRSIPFILNLNAARNHFIADCPRPIVIWMPDYLMRTIAAGAPDFFSVRSGIYTFASPPPEAQEAPRQTFQTLGYTEMAGLSFEGKQQRIAELEDLRTRLQNLPQEQRDPLDEATIINELAEMYYAMARYDEASPLYNEALEIRRKTLPPNHHDISQSLNHLATLYKATGKYNEAEELYQEALAICRKSLPINYSDIARNLSDLAELYLLSGNFALAETLNLEALKIKRETLPPNYPDIALSLNNLAELYQVLRRYDEAARLYHEALEIWRKALAPDHLNIAFINSNLALLYQTLGRYKEAETLYLEALKISQRALGNDHVYTQEIRKYLARFQRTYQLDKEQPSQ